MKVTALARVALDVMSKADVKADDETIEAVRDARRMLHAIVTGALVVSVPQPALPAQPPEAAAPPTA
jgi:hypothetical protein